MLLAAPVSGVDQPLLFGRQVVGVLRREARLLLFAPDAVQRRLDGGLFRIVTVRVR
jgi:hypothetical protein